MPLKMALTSFALFPCLPIELRHLIWTFTFPGPRRIAPSTISAHKRSLYDSKPKTPEHCCPYNPITLRINRESREVTLLYYRTWLNAASAGYQYVDFSIDTISFDASTFAVDSQRPPGMELLRLTRMDMQRIERLDLGFWGLRDGIGKDLKRWIKTRLSIFTGVTELRVLLLVSGRESKDPDTMASIKSMVDETRDLGEKGIEECFKGIGGIEGPRKPPFLSVITLEDPMVPAWPWRNVR